MAHRASPRHMHLAGSQAPLQAWYQRLLRQTRWSFGLHALRQPLCHGSFGPPSPAQEVKRKLLQRIKAWYRVRLASASLLCFSAVQGAANCDGYLLSTTAGAVCMDSLACGCNGEDDLHHGRLYCQLGHDSRQSATPQAGWVQCLVFFLSFWPWLGPWL